MLKRKECETPQINNSASTDQVDKIIKQAEVLRKLYEDLCAIQTKVIESQAKLAVTRRMWVVLPGGQKITAHEHRIVESGVLEFNDITPVMIQSSYHSDSPYYVGNKLATVATFTPGSFVSVVPEEMAGC